MYEESYLASIEYSQKFDISASSDHDYYCILPINNAYINGVRYEYYSEYCYFLKIE